MRHARPALAAIAVLSLTLLAGCATAATPEEKAEQELKSFVAASNGDGDIHYCDGADESVDRSGWELVDEDDITVESHSEPNRWSVQAPAHPIGDEERVETNSIDVIVSEDGETCVAAVYGFVNVG